MVQNIHGKFQKNLSTIFISEESPEVLIFTEFSSRFSACYMCTYFLLADENKRKFIDRFVQSVAYHGPSLITLTKDEQGDGEGSATDFLHPTTEGYVAMNYFKSRLQVSKVFENLRALAA